MHRTHLSLLAAAGLAAATLLSCVTVEDRPEPDRADGWSLRVLGVAQDGGLPHLGCIKEHCEAARRGERRAERVTCLGLTDGERTYLFDATPDFPAQVHAMGARKPDGVFLTHAHIGHYTGLIHLGKEVLGARDVPVFCTPRMASFLSGNGPWDALVQNGHIALRDNERVDLGGVVVTAFQVPHRAEYTDTVGYRIEGPRRTALFLPDIDRWSDWERDIRTVVEGVDLAFLDATFYSLDELPHRDIEKVRHPLVTESMQRLTGLGDRVFFIHLNHSNPVLGDPSLVEDDGFHLASESDAAFDL